MMLPAPVFAWKSAHHIHRDSHVREDGIKVYFLHGPLFFGSTTDFTHEFSPASDPDEVIIDFADSRVWDHSGLEAIQKLADRYRAANKTLHLQHLSSNCRDLLRKAGTMVDIVILPDDPTYQVARVGGDLVS